MRLISLWLLVGFSVAEGETLVNWSANYPPCNQHSELLKQGHMDLGVRVATANPFLAIDEYLLLMKSAQADAASGGDRGDGRFTPRETVAQRTLATFDADF
jgi:hypothetical protein